MAQTVLKHSEDTLLVPSLGVDHALRMQADARQSRGEQVPLAQAPEDRPLHPREDAGDEEDGRRPVNGAEPPARHLVQGAKLEPTGGKPCVEIRYTEGDRTSGFAV